MTSTPSTPGYGCFTTMRVDPLPDGAGVGVRGWQRHLARLQRDSLALVGEAVPRASVVSAVRGATDGVALPILVRVAVEPDPRICAMVSGVSRHLPGCRHAKARSWPLATTTRAVTPSDRPLRVRATRHDRFRPEMKHTLTAPELAERDAAIEEGYDDAVFVTADGLLSEGTTWSLLLGRPDGTWVTPLAESLPSVTVALLAERVTLSVEEVRADALDGFDRAAAVGSGRGVHRIASIGPWRTSRGVDELASAYASVPLDPV
ncbi:MAG: aminotransferase class IV [Nocardioides sp.]|uniref:aminotransferase class IV n=1 Tax=Nocardioides sp. TaxID=35761 RepID=UPI0039E3D2D5